MKLSSRGDFEKVYQQYAQPIYRFLYWQTRDPVLSQDLTSVVFERAWKSRGRFKGGSVQAWLYRIARNALTDHWRRKKPFLIGDVEGLAEQLVAPSAAYDFDQEQVLLKLSAALGKLPPELQTIVVLRFIEEVPAKQVAEALSLSEVNVRVKQFRALKQLRKLLQDHAEN